MKGFRIEYCGPVPGTGRHRRTAKCNSLFVRDGREEDGDE